MSWATHTLRGNCLEITLKPLEDFHEVEQVEKPARLPSRARRMAGEVVAVLRKLDEYDSPETPVEQYLETRSGKYAIMLEGIVDAAATAGMWDLARVALVDLLRMTKIGRAKADLNIGAKLRDEIPLKHLSDEELHGLVDKPASD